MLTLIKPLNNFSNHFAYDVSIECYAVYSFLLNDVQNRIEDIAKVPNKFLVYYGCCLEGTLDQVGVVATIIRAHGIFEEGVVVVVEELDHVA